MKVTIISSLQADAMADELTSLANLLRAHGPAAYVSGAIMVSRKNEDAALFDYGDGKVVSTARGPDRIAVQSDLVLRVLPASASPPGGVVLWPTTGFTPALRWDGGPQRPPRKDEWYKHGTRFKCAGRNLKKPRWIYNES